MIHTHTHTDRLQATIGKPEYVRIGRCLFKAMMPTWDEAQAQQSAEDSELIHKVGNTRIIIEQVNEQGKTEHRYFRGPTPILQLTLVSHIMRVAFCFGKARVLVNAERVDEARPLVERFREISGESELSDPSVQALLNVCGIDV